MPMLPMMAEKCIECPILRSMLKAFKGSAWGDGIRDKAMFKAGYACTEALHNGECPFYVEYYMEEDTWTRSVKLHQRSM